MSTTIIVYNHKACSRRQNAIQRLSAILALTVLMMRLSSWLISAWKAKVSGSAMAPNFSVPVFALTDSRPAFNVLSDLRLSL